MIVKMLVNTWREKIGLCSCGMQVELGRILNSCPCGIDYNSEGKIATPFEKDDDPFLDFYKGIED
jgi:hypothetical protein